MITKIVLIALVSLVPFLTGCAGPAMGMSVYKYEHKYADGEYIKGEVKSANQVGKLEMGIEAGPDGNKELKLKLDNLTKNDNTVEIVKSVEGITGNIAGMFSPLLQAALPQN